MAEGDGEGIGGVGRPGKGVEAKERLYHGLDLLFAPASVGGDEPLYFQGLVEGDRQTGAGGGQQGGGARLAQGDGGADVPDDEVLDGDFIGATIADDAGKGIVDLEEALGVGKAGGKGYNPEVNSLISVVLSQDEAVTGDAEAGIDAENDEPA